MNLRGSLLNHNRAEAVGLRKIKNNYRLIFGCCAWIHISNPVHIDVDQDAINPASRASILPSFLPLMKREASAMSTPRDQLLGAPLGTRDDLLLRYWSKALQIPG